MHHRLRFRQRLKAETANSLTHGVGVGLSMAATAILLAKAVTSGGVLRITSAAIYGACMILVFLSSAAYHSMMQPRARRLFLVLDHSSIFLAIAGTYTPLSLVLLHGPLGWKLFTAVWSLALAGIFFKTLYIDCFDFLSMFIYVLLGWMVLFVIRSLSAAMHNDGFVLFFGTACTSYPCTCTCSNYRQERTA